MSELFFLGSVSKSLYYMKLLASFTQLDVHPAGDQEVVGLTPAGTNILSWRFDHGIFSMVILFLLLIQEEQLSVSEERMCTILVNHFDD